MCTIYIFLLESSDITRAEKERALSEYNAQSSRSREKHLATSRVSPSLLPCSGRFLRALQQNKGQSRCLFVKQIISYTNYY